MGLDDDLPVRDQKSPGIEDKKQMRLPAAVIHTRN